MPTIEQRLLDLFGDAYAPYVENFPRVMADELLHDDRGFITRDQMSLELARRFRPAHRDMASPDVLRDILPKTAFTRTRMQPLYGNIGHVRSLRHPGYGYYPYVPLNFMLTPKPAATLIVAVHGSSRNAKDHRDAFSAFAEAEGCFVLAPLFPIELDLPVPDEEYKYVAGSRTRYDLVLLDMIEEFAGHVGVTFDRVFYFGFSGGGQFCHRMFYVHPEKMDLVVAASPGFVSLPLASHDWWVGVRDLEQVFGRPMNVEAMAKTPLLLLCGGDDTIPFEIYSADEMGMTVDEYAAYGATRTVRLERLRQEYEKLGVKAEMEIVPGCAHDFRGPMHDVTRQFMKRFL